MPRKNKPLTTEQTIIRVCRNLVDEGIEILETLENLTNEQEKTVRRALGKFNGASANHKMLVNNAEESEED